MERMSAFIPTVSRHRDLDSSRVNILTILFGVFDCLGVVGDVKYGWISWSASWHQSVRQYIEKSFSESNESRNGLISCNLSVEY